MSDTNETYPAKRESSRFVAGVSGNPTGRPKGSRNKITLLKESLELMLRERAAPDLPAVLDKAVELAVSGDRAMIKLLLELHMAKGTADKENAVEKVEININSDRPRPADSGLVIDVTPTKVHTSEE
jgi:hypothetical protein